MGHYLSSTGRPLIWPASLGNSRASRASHDGLAVQGAESIDGLFLARHVNQKGHGVILLADGWNNGPERKNPGAKLAVV